VSETRLKIAVAFAMLALMMFWMYPELKRRGIYKRFADSMERTGTILIEMDQRSNKIITVSSAGHAFFGRDVVGLNVHEIMPKSLRAGHDVATGRVNTSIENGTFQPHVFQRYTYALARGKKVLVYLRVHVTGDRICVAMIDPRPIVMQDGHDIE